jgi:NAD(P)-dependent dehydrogenase (short-subunit alcohol dehydrogenase family)
MLEFHDKVAVVTGAASGIGLAMATRFAEEGMKVVLADIEAPALEASVAQLREQGHDVVGVRTDVSSTTDIEALREAALEAYGTVHVLCNNAGVVPTNSDPAIFGGTDKDWEWGLGVNVLSVVRGVRTFLPVMEAHGEAAHVVNTSSAAGLISAGDTYGVTKHAVVSFTEGLYNHLAETGSQVQCSVLCPGLVSTRIMSSARNRPESLVESAAAEQSPEDLAIAEAMDAVFARGMPPEEVAGQTFDAIREGRFWIITDHGTDDLIRARMESILSRDNPVPLPPFGTDHPVTQE